MALVEDGALRRSRQLDMGNSGLGEILGAWPEQRSNIDSLVKTRFEGVPAI